MVREISLGLSYGFTVEEAVKLFGPPEAVGIVAGGTPENWYRIVDMFYPSMGMQLRVYTPNFSSEIKPSTDIGADVLFSPTSVEKRL